MNGYDKLYEILPYLQEAQVSITESPWEFKIVVNSGNPERRLQEFEKKDLRDTFVYLWSKNTAGAYGDFPYTVEFTENDNVPVEIEIGLEDIPVPLNLDNIPLEEN